MTGVFEINTYTTHFILDRVSYSTVKRISTLSTSPNSRVISSLNCEFSLENDDTRNCLYPSLQARVYSAMKFKWPRIQMSKRVSSSYSMGAKFCILLTNICTTLKVEVYSFV